MIRLWRSEWFERTSPIEQVDFGNGHFVSADDLLDGHFQRLVTQADPDETAIPSHPEQADQDLHTMMGRVAPTLTPLTDLAESVAERIPEAHPNGHFRDTLNKALTETHRQHSAQRTLGIRAGQPEPNAWQSFMLVGLILLIVTLGVAWYGQWLSQPIRDSGES